jgi:hypothetical protein
MQFDRLVSQDVDKTCGILCDQIIRLSGFYSLQDYPDRLRRIKYHDTETDKTLAFITNNFFLPSPIIARLYKCRWEVGVSSKGHTVQSVKDRPRLKDSGLVAWEAS